MVNKFTKFNNDDRAFSGLEAAIVLIAFVVVAAAFSFAVLNAGFFATQEATGAIHTGLAEATSALQIGGDVVATGNLNAPPGITNVTQVSIPVMLAAGGRPIDLNVDRTIISYVDVADSIINVHDSGNDNTTVEWVRRHDGGANDEILEFGELALITINLNSGTLTGNNVINLDSNEEFTITIQPPQGAALTIEKQIPSFIDGKMILRN